MRIGIDLGGTKIAAVALGGDGAVLAERRVATPQTGYEAALEAIAGLVDGIEAACGETGTVGVGMPGSLSPTTGLVHNANSTWLNGRRFGADLEAALLRPVRLANDANCFALSEAADGAGAGASVVFGVILGTGVGGGLVVDGRLVAGHQAIAGEWGHNPLPAPADDERPGERCHCGRDGCIETFLSGPALARAYRRAGGPAIPAVEIAGRAAAGEALADRILERHAERLARALAGIINIVDPDVIVLGGGLSSVSTLYARVPELWRAHVFSDTVTTALLPPVHGDASGVRGAARLWP